VTASTPKDDETVDTVSSADSSSTKTSKELAWAAFRDGYKMGKSVEHVQEASLEAAQAEFDVWWRLHESERSA